jgi:hypothetical protein
MVPQKNNHQNQIDLEQFQFMTTGCGNKETALIIGKTSVKVG